MKSHRQTKIIFAGEFEEFFGAVQIPEAWPSFLFEEAEIHIELKGMEKSELKVVSIK